MSTQIRGVYKQVIALRDVIPPPLRREFTDVYIATELMDTDLHQIIRSNQNLSEEHCQVRYCLFSLFAWAFGCVTCERLIRNSCLCSTSCIRFFEVWNTFTRPMWYTETSSLATFCWTRTAISRYVISGLLVPLRRTRTWLSTSWLGGTERLSFCWTPRITPRPLMYGLLGVFIWSLWPEGRCFPAEITFIRCAYWPR